MDKMIRELSNIKPIEGFGNNYFISEDGVIISRITKTEKEIGGTISKWGYRTASLRLNGECTKHYIHRLVAQTFIPNDDCTKIVINHKDGNKLNNHFSNLEWCTSKENNKHAREMGLNTHSGENHTQCKLEEAEVYVIRKLHSTGRFSQQELADIFSVHQVHIGRIIREERRVI